MSALNASWNFLSGIAVQFGAEPSLAVERSSLPLFSQRLRKKKRAVRKLDKAEREELVESIRHDDWFE